MDRRTDSRSARKKFGSGKSFIPDSISNLGIASDVNVATFTRFAMRTDLLGRPRPLGRRSLQTTPVVSETTLTREEEA